MYYDKIYDHDNFSQIENFMNERIARTKENYKENEFNGTSYARLAVCGDAAIQLYCETYGAKFSSYKPFIKTDGKTRARFVRYITVEFHYDARPKTRGGSLSSNCYNYGGVPFYVEIDGVKLDPTFDRNGKAVFRLFADGTDYNTYLPYNWDEMNQEPNKVGTITDKKLLEWVNWLQARKAAADAEKAKRENGVNDLFSRLQSLNTESFDDCILNASSGRIEKNGLVYSYHISPGGYIKEEIKVSYKVSNKLESFLKMINGAY